MLSRVANSIHWMARYLERAENLARFIDVTLNVILDQPEGSAEQWEPLVRATGDNEYFAQQYGRFTSENVRQFLTFDPDYSNSILSVLSLARENARTVREAIPSEVWEQLNTFYHFVRDARTKGHLAATSDFYSLVRQHSHLLSGITDATMSRGKAWHFANLGRLLERADKTSRILDVKYYVLLPDARDVGTTIDDLHWSAVLRSVSGFEMFRKRYRSLTIGRIVEFLVLDRHFPRAIRYCVEEAGHSLRQLGGPVTVSQNIARRRLSTMVDRLDGNDAEGIIVSGLHEYIDDLQAELNRVSEAVHETYFAFRPTEQTQSQTSGQSQSQSST